MLELDDIQHILLRARPARRRGTGSSRSAARGRPDLARRHLDKVHRRPRRGSVDENYRWVTVAFTWNGLRALGVTEASLATFPEEFRQGMAARAEILGDTGANHPDHWVGGLASPDLHAIVILFARDVAERERCSQEHQQLRRAVPRAWRSSRRWTWRRPRRSTTRTTTSAIATDCPAGHRGIGRRADARLGRPAQGRRVLPRLPRRGRHTSPACPSRRSSPATAASWPTGDWRSTSARSATSCARTARRPRNRN